MITDYRGEKWRGAGSSNFFWRTLMSFHFFWRSENSSFTPTPTLRPFLLSSTRARTLAQRRLWAARTLAHFHHSVGVAQAWPEKDRGENPFCSAEWGLHIPLFPHDNSQHLAVKKKMPILGFFCSTLDCKMGECVSSWKKKSLPIHSLFLAVTQS